MGFTTDGPHEHRIDLHHWDCGYGGVYTHTHDPVKGTINSPLMQSNCSTGVEFSASRDPFRFSPNLSQSSRLSTGKLPKLNFSKFDGDDPKLWRSRCGNYFEMYMVEPTVWVKVAMMHLEGPAARWL
jgi:hypothetical protein